MGFIAAQVLNSVAVALGKIPDIARIEIIGFRKPIGANHRRANAAFDDESPLGGIGVPVQFAQAARLQPHRHAGEASGNRQLLDRRLLGGAPLGDASFLLLHREVKGRQLFVLLDGFSGRSGSGESRRNNCGCSDGFSSIEFRHLRVPMSKEWMHECSQRIDLQGSMIGEDVCQSKHRLSRDDAGYSCPGGF